MRLPKNLAKAQAARDKKPLPPEKWTLAQLVTFIRKHDPEYRGLTELEVFKKTCDDAVQAREMYEYALRHCEHSGMRTFCLSRIEHEKELQKALKAYMTSAKR